jgi:mRNA guanylyltransferase
MPGSVPEIPGIKAEEHLARSFRQEVAHLLHRNNPNFPGAQPVSFGRHHLDELCQQDYFLCEKTDGIRCLLYCTEDDAGNEIHYLIDRKNDYYFLKGSGFASSFSHFYC